MFFTTINKLTSGVKSIIAAIYSIGGSPGFGRGGAKNYFSERHAAHGEAMRFVRGVCPRENFFKWCNLVRFGVYFD